MQTESRIWSVDLDTQWNGAGLPQIVIEKETSSGGERRARAALSRAELPAQEWFDLDEPVVLLTHRESKPWGAEVWFTGIEKRGICRVENGMRQRLSLPAYLALQANEGSDIATPPLLKILDPFADRSRGSLYIEVHEKKWETYIVTGIDPSLYPDGKGELLFGFSKNKLAEFGGDQQKFKSALLADVRRYEVYRRTLDGELGEQSPSATAETATQAESTWRCVQSYFNMLKVGLGDVVQVPPFTPHSLQAGVCVVEFQTPVYERLILAFNQKVLTQGHWDSKKAIESASFGTPDLSLPEPQTGWQQIVSFPEFDVERCRLDSSAAVSVQPSKSNGHRVLFVISGNVEVHFAGSLRSMKVIQGQAVLLPATAVLNGISLAHAGTAGAGCLLV